MIVTCGGPINTQDSQYFLAPPLWWIISQRFGLWVTIFADLIFGCHSTSNFQHICQNNFSLQNRYLPGLCTHLEGTHPLLFSEFQLMNQIFGSTALITVDVTHKSLTSNFQHICQYNFYLPNPQPPRLCTHLEGTHLLLFPEFQLMNPIFGSTALITVDHPSKPQSTITITTHSNHSPVTAKPQPKHIPMPPSARIHQHIGPSMWMLGLVVFRSRV